MAWKGFGRRDERVSLVLAAAVGAVAFGAEAPAAAHARMQASQLAAEVRSYRIPAGAIGMALNRLAEENGVQMVFLAGLTRDVETRGLSGEYTLGAALRQLLAGTGLSYRLADDEREVFIVLAQNDAGARSDAGGAEALPPIDVGAAAAQARAGGQGNGQRGGGGPGDPTAYRTESTSTATKTRTPIIETPVSVQVAPQQILRDQQIVVVDDALANISSVTPIPVGGLQSGFVVRGFETYKYYLDGVRVDNKFTTPRREMANVESVEVLKGPASILYGRLEPGGLINIVTKKPSVQEHYELQQQFGSYGFYRTTLGLTGPLTADKTLLYRFDAAYENSDSFRELTHTDRIFIAPKIHYEPMADFRANAYLEYQRGRSPLDFGSPYIGGRPTSVSITRNYGEAGSESYVKDDLRIGFDWSYDIDRNWTVSHRFDANFRDGVNNIMVPLWPSAASCSYASCPVDRIVNRPAVQSQAYFTSFDVKGRFDTFGLTHNVLAGGDYYLDNYKIQRVFSFSAPSIDLFNPVHTGFPNYLYGNPDWAFSIDAGQNWYGFYFQDQIALPYDFHLLAGFRYDKAKMGATALDTVPAPATLTSMSSDNDAIKPRIGLLWRPIPQLSLYGSYVENFGLSPVVDGSTRPTVDLLAPTSARQWEFGAKTDLFDGRLTATVAWFDIVKNNIPTPSSDPVRAALGAQVSTGEARNRGWEFDVSGQVTSQIKVIGSYSYIDSTILKDNNGNVGHRLYGVPKSAGSLWAVYEPDFEALRGASFGAGFVARSSVQGNNANSFQIPGYAVVNLMARYSFLMSGLTVTAQLNVNNLLDKTYYLSPGDTIGILPGAPRSFLGSLKVEF
ncbi:TonB-dependent receptor [Methylosinus sp. Sm6]|uniref:TonB-dependent siderophore receptor n=1 Tax=Methylosinus sp. Sm6 TaxID=2866948 RepID=UPI001C993E84|nr:TonB-dependent receptor [Methylosinus sp. Sm6]MBY6240322.1 TonB-dependent receptor [Methylosinus sp. Sm6]